METLNIWGGVGKQFIEDSPKKPYEKESEEKKREEWKTII